MFNYLFLASLLVFLQVASSATNSAPWKSWSFCKKPDPTQTSTCLIKAIQGVEKDIVDGSTYFGLPKLNPLRIDRLALYQAESGKSVAVNITFTNCEVNGLLGWELSDVKANWDTGILTGFVRFKNDILFDADYEVGGKVILLPVLGKGKAKITFEELQAAIKIIGKTVSRKGKKYFNIDDFEVELKPKSAVFKFGDLLGKSDSAFGQSINRALTENWKEIMDDVKGPIGQGLGAAFKQIADRVFSKIPFDVLVPN